MATQTGYKGQKLLDFYLFSIKYFCIKSHDSLLCAAL